MGIPAMAKEKEEQAEAEGEEKAKGGSSTMKIVIIAVILALVVGGGLVAGTLYFVNDSSDEKSSVEEGEDGEDGEEVVDTKPKSPPLYTSMDPKFVVSFKKQNNARFMQFSLHVMSRDKEVENKIKEHMPVIRSSLLMMFGAQNYESMITREGKEKFLSDAVIDINASLKKAMGVEEIESEVEAAYFTSFVIQ